MDMGKGQIERLVGRGLSVWATGQSVIGFVGRGNPASTNGESGNATPDSYKRINRTEGYLRTIRASASSCVATKSRVVASVISLFSTLTFEATWPIMTSGLFRTWASRYTRI